MSQIEKLIEKLKHTPYSIHDRQQLIDALNKFDKFNINENNKSVLVNQVIYILQCKKSNIIPNLNTILYGVPSDAKKEFASCLIEIWKCLNVMENCLENCLENCPKHDTGSNMDRNQDQFVLIKREDLVGEYLGWTEKKTLAILEKNIGGFIYIQDGHNLCFDETDEFGIECLNTINNFIGRNKIHFIISSYKSEFLDSFPGLQRRFMWNFCG